MLEALFQATWSPYAAGAGIGVLVCFSFLLCDRPLGASSAYMKARGLLERAVDPHLEEKKEFYREIEPRVDGVLMILPGIIIGACISAVLSGQFHLSWVPALWAAAFGDNAMVRLIGAFGGGIILAFGSRWAGGCTSGHGISGTSQLSLASILSTACFFIGGIATAFLIFHFPGM